jgi:hypothetical protein
MPPNYRHLLPASVRAEKLLLSVAEKNGQVTSTDLPGRQDWILIGDVGPIAALNEYRDSIDKCNING